MKKWRYEAFWNFHELSAEKQFKFDLYKGLNDIIQKEKIKPDLVNDSALKILLDIWKQDIDFSDYSELDHQVKLLIEEHKLAISNIYEFVETKFPFKKEEYIKILNQMDALPVWEIEGIVDMLFQKQEGIFIINIFNIRDELISRKAIPFNINSNFVKNLEYFKKKVWEVDISQFSTGPVSAIGVGVSIL